MLVVPGPSVLYLVTQSIGSGRRGGFAAMAGIQCAGAVHIALTAAGLAALVNSSRIAFSLLASVGAAYLIGLGVMRWVRGVSVADRAGMAEPIPAAVLFRRGFVVNLTNPKSAVFFVAVLPQFIDPDRGPTSVQVLVLGAIFLATAVITDGAWVIASGWVGERIRTERARRVERFASSLVLIALGIAAALQRPAAS